MREDDLADVWARSLDDLADMQIEPHQRAWLQLTRPLGLVENTALIAAPNDFVKEQLETRLRALITNALSRELDRSIQLAVTVDPARDGGRAAAPAPGGRSARRRSRPRPGPDGTGPRAGRDRDPGQRRRGRRPGAPTSPPPGRDAAPGSPGSTARGLDGRDRDGRARTPPGRPGRRGTAAGGHPDGDSRGADRNAALGLAAPRPGAGRRPGGRRRPPRGPAPTAWASRPGPPRPG